MNHQSGKNMDSKFIELTLKTFSFLLQLGFRVSRQSDTLIRFESTKVFINVYHGQLDHMINLEIGRIDYKELFSLYELLRYVAPNAIELGRWQAVSQAVLEKGLSRIALTLEQRCQDLLTGNTRAFETLSAATRPHRHQITLNAQFGPIIDRADKAWESKHHDLAIELYEAAEPALDKSRKRRLDYLKRKKKTCVQAKEE